MYKILFYVTSIGASSVAMASSANSRKKLKSSGFTLFELMVTLAIAAILLTLSLPSFTRLIQSTHMSSSVNTFLADMRYARSEAIRRGGWVVMCRSNNPEAALPTCVSPIDSVGNGWVSGWIIFHGVDSDDGGVTTTQTLLRMQSPNTALNSILESTGNSSTKFRFTATGRLADLTSDTTLNFGAAPVFATIDQRTVCVGLGGHARIGGNGATTCPQ